MGDVVLVVLVGRLGLLVEELVDLPGRHADALQDIALAENAEHQLTAHLFAVSGVIHALLRQSVRQL